MVTIYPPWIEQCERTQPVQLRTVFAVLPATHVSLHTNHVNTCRRPGIEFQRLQIIPFLCWINTFKYTTSTTNTTLPFADYTLPAHTVSCTHTHARKQTHTHTHTEFKRATARLGSLIANYQLSEEPVACIFVVLVEVGHAEKRKN